MRFKDANSKSLLENFLSLSVLQVISSLLPLAVLFYLTEIIGMGNIGRIAFALSVLQYFVSIVDFGFKLTGTREIASCSSDLQQVSRVFCTIMSVKILLAGCSLLLIVLLIRLIPLFRENALLILFAYGVVLGDVLIPVWFFQGMEKMKYMTLANALMHVSFFLLTIALIRKESDYIWVPLLQSAGYVLAGIISMLLVARSFKVRFVRVTPGEVFKMMGRCWHVFVTSFLPNLYNNSTEFILGVYTRSRPELLGDYSVAKRVTDALISLVTIITQTYFPLLVRDKKYFRAFKKVVLWSGLGLSLLAIVGSSLAEGVLPSDKLHGVIPLVQLLGPSPFFMAIIMYYGRCYLLTNRLDGLYLKIAASISVIGLILALVFISWLLQYGASMSLVISRGLFGLLCFIAAWRHMRRAQGQSPSRLIQPGA